VLVAITHFDQLSDRKLTRAGRILHPEQEPATTKPQLTMRLTKAWRDNGWFYILSEWLPRAIKTKMCTWELKNSRGKMTLVGKNYWRMWMVPALILAIALTSTACWYADVRVPTMRECAYQASWMRSVLTQSEEMDPTITLYWPTVNRGEPPELDEEPGTWFGWLSEGTPVKPKKMGGKIPTNLTTYTLELPGFSVIGGVFWFNATITNPFSWFSTSPDGTTKRAVTFEPWVIQAIPVHRPALGKAIIVACIVSTLMTIGLKLWRATPFSQMAKFMKRSNWLQNTSGETNPQRPSDKYYTDDGIVVRSTVWDHANQCWLHEPLGVNADGTAHRKCDQVQPPHWLSPMFGERLPDFEGAYRDPLLNLNHKGEAKTPTGKQTIHRHRNNGPTLGQRALLYVRSQFNHALPENNKANRILVGSHLHKFIESIGGYKSLRVVDHRELYTTVMCHAFVPTHEDLRVVKTLTNPAVQQYVARGHFKDQQ